MSDLPTVHGKYAGNDSRARIVFENNDSEELLVMPLGSDLYRLEESSAVLFRGERTPRSGSSAPASLRGSLRSTTRGARWRNHGRIAIQLLKHGLVLL